MLDWLRRLLGMEKKEETPAPAAPARPMMPRPQAEPPKTAPAQAPTQPRPRPQPQPSAQPPAQAPTRPAPRVQSQPPAYRPQTPPQPLPSARSTAAQIETSRPLPGAHPAGPVPMPTAPSAPTAKKSTAEEAQIHLARLREKISLLAERFASGSINRKQFQDLYAHYQAEIQSIEQILSLDPDSDEWRNAVKEGQSILIRMRNAARVVGFSIYDIRSGMPIKTVGQFGVDPDLFVPMLHAYQSASQEIFGAGIRSTQIQGGQWLAFVPGKVSTTLVLFSTEPAARQMQTFEELHRIFEQANAQLLNNPPVDPEALVCPQEIFFRRAQ